MDAEDQNKMLREEASALKSQLELSQVNIYSKEITQPSFSDAFLLDQFDVSRELDPVKPS